MRMAPCRFLLPLALFALALALTPAPQAAAQTAPSSAQPERLQQRFQPQPQPRVREQPLIPELKQPLPPEQASKITFALKDIRLEGVTVYDPAALRPLYQDKLGQSSSLAVVYQIADAIAAKYRNDGYVLVQVFPPAQEVADGVVRLQVVEGFIHKVEIEGEAGPHLGRLRAYAARIQGSRPLRAADLERYLLLANDLPGLEAKALLLPSTEQVGASDLILQVKHKPYSALASVDNRGTRFVGAIQTELSGRLNGVLGTPGMLELRLIGTPQIEELRYIEGTYLTPVGNDSLRVGVRAIASWSEPGFTLEPLDVKADSQTVEAWVGYDIVRARRRNLSIKGSATYRDSHSDALGMALSEDRLRYLELGLTGDFTDDYGGINLGALRLRQGLDVFGAKGNSRPAGNTDFTKLNLEATRLQKVTDDVRLLLTAKSQYAFSELLAAEEFGFGGADLGRAFDPSEFTGDHGIAGQIEAQYVGLKVPALDRLVLYAFYDYGVVWRIDDSTRDHQKSAASAGFGARFGFLKHYSGYLEFGVPLVNDVAARGPTKGDDWRAFFSLSARF